ncbi:hypothetical protein ACOSP7_028476 [Xanthoceras sorbifolium]
MILYAQEADSIHNFFDVVLLLYNYGIIISCTNLDWVVRRSCVSFFLKIIYLLGEEKKLLSCGCILMTVFVSYGWKKLRDHSGEAGFLLDKVRIWVSLWAYVVVEFQDFSFIHHERVGCMKQRMFSLTFTMSFLFKVIG